MARYDKYNPFSGGFRAPLAANWLDADVAVPVGVGLNANGRIVKGAGNTGIVGVIVIDSKGKVAGTVVDTMTAGEIVDCTGLTAGTTYYINDTTGALETAAPAAGVNKVLAGRTVEAQRLVVQVQRAQG